MTQAKAQGITVEERIRLCDQARFRAHELKDLAGEVDALAWEGHYYRSAKKPERAQKCFEAALRLDQLAGRQAGEVTEIANIGAVLFDETKYSQSNEMFVKASNLGAALGNRRAVLQADHWSALCMSRLGSYPEAHSIYKRSLTEAIDLDDPQDEVSILSDLIQFCRKHNRLREALDYSKQLLVVSQKLKNRGTEYAALATIGSIHRSLGEERDALEFYQRARPIEKEASRWFDYATSTYLCGYINDELGYHEKTIELDTEAQNTFKRLGDKMMVALMDADMAGTYLSMGFPDRAEKLFLSALPVLKTSADKEFQVRTYRGLARVSAARGELKKALEFMGKAVGFESGSDFDFLRRWDTSYLSYLEVLADRFEQARSPLSQSTFESAKIKGLVSIAPKLKVWALLCKHWGNSRLAIAMLKANVNFELTRTEEGWYLSREQMKRYPKIANDPYQLLVSWLSAAGRKSEAAEAQKLLDAANAARIDGTGPRPALISVTASEKTWIERLRSEAAAISVLGQRERELLLVAPSVRSKAQTHQLTTLERELEKARAPFFALLENKPHGKSGSQ